MRSRLAVSILAVLLVFMLTFACTNVPAAVSQNNTTEIKSLLESLRDEVSALPDEAFENLNSAEGQRKALTNKINAVIHQIDAGAFNGSINKLENDLKNTIMEWITSEYEASLIQKVDEIIDLIKGVPPKPTPPTASFTFTPLTPLVGETVIFDASASKPNGGVIDSYAWDFGDGASIAEDDSITTYAYSKVGDYTVTLNVTDSEGLSDTEQKVITVVSMLIHDIAIIKVKAYPPVVKPGTIVHINVTVANQGTKDETFNITVFYDETMIAKKTGISLGVGAEETLLFHWNTTGVVDGVYKIIAKADVVAEEIDVADNVYVNGSVKIDSKPPLVRIIKPGNQSYLSGVIEVEVFVWDENLEKAELTINGTSVAGIISLQSLASSIGESTFTYTWDTTAPAYEDGVYIIELSALDKAENFDKEKIIVIVDNTLPRGLIITPGGFIGGKILIHVTGEDTNFDKMQLEIDDIVVKAWSVGGGHTYEWNTKAYVDGAHVVELIVLDKAGNSVEASVTMLVDNTAPTIEPPVWQPAEPSADEKVNVTVRISDQGSGVKNATLWYKNETLEAWQPITMTIKDGNWTATIPGQRGGATVKFNITSYDNVGNSAETILYEYAVKAPPGLPLDLILAAIAILAGATGGGAYYIRRKRKKGASATSVPSRPAPSQVPTQAPTKRAARRRV